MAREEAGTLELQVCVDPLAQVVGHVHADAADHTPALDDHDEASRDAGEDPQRRQEELGAACGDAVDPLSQEQGDERLEEPREQEPPVAQPEGDSVPRKIRYEPEQ